MIAGKSISGLTVRGFASVHKLTDATDTEPFRHVMANPTESRIKKQLVTKALTSGLVPGSSRLHDSAYIHKLATVSIGSATLIATRAIVHSNSTISDYVRVSPVCVFGPDSVAGDFVAISPASHLLGHVALREGVMLGAGTIVRGYTSIAPGVYTDLYTGVAKDIDEPGITVVGISARPLAKKHDEVLP